MKKIIFFLMCVLTFAFAERAQSQTMTVNSMKAMAMDLSASTNPRNDNNGKPCALVKVSLTVPNATFSGNPVGEISRDGSDYWVYMPAGSKRLWIKHPDYKELEVDFATYGIARLQGKVTYKVDVEVPFRQYAPQPVVPQTPSTQNQTVINKKAVKFSKSKDAVSMFFPLYGITLGKTTNDDLRRIGYNAEVTNYDRFESFFLESLIFNHHFNTGQAYNEVTFNASYIPAEWKERYGFDKSLSYNQWRQLFQDMNFNVEVVCPPYIGQYKGRDIMIAKLIASSPDQQLRFLLEFNFGNDKGEGTSTDSPNSLYYITCNRVGTTTFPQKLLKQSESKAKKFKTTAAIDEFFPIYGATIGKSSYADLVKLGYSPNEPDEDNTSYCNVNDWLFSDFSSNPGFIYRVHSADRESMPEKWVQKGFQWGNSYNTWIKVLKNMGYAVVVLKEPKETPANSKEPFKAEIRGISPDASLRIDLDFKYGKGHTKDAANTLYGICFTVIEDK